MLHSIGSAEKRAKETPFKVQIRSKDDTFEIEVFSWTTLHVLKEMIQAKIGVKLKDQRIFYDNQELIRNNQNMFDYNISSLFSSHFWVKVSRQRNRSVFTSRSNHR